MKDWFAGDKGQTSCHGMSLWLMQIRQPRTRMRTFAQIAQLCEYIASKGAEMIKWGLEIALNKFPSSIWDELKKKKVQGKQTGATCPWGESGYVQGHCSSTLLSNQVFADSRPHPWSRWKSCLLNCREAPCCIAVMFFSGTFPFPVSPSTRRSTGHFAEAYEWTSVGDSYLSKQCWKGYFLSDQSVDSIFSIIKQKHTESS